MSALPSPPPTVIVPRYASFAPYSQFVLCAAAPSLVKRSAVPSAPEMVETNRIVREFSADDCTQNGAEAGDCTAMVP